MPKCQNNLFPENFKIKMSPLLARFVNAWVLINIVLIQVYLEIECKKARPAGEYCIVKHWKPIREEYLTREAIEDWKVDLSECQHDILIEVVAYHLCDSPVSPSSMN